MTAHAAKDVNQGKHSFIVNGIGKLYSHFGNAYDRKLRNNLPQDPDILILGIYPKDTKPQGHLVKHIHRIFFHNKAGTRNNLAFLNQRMDKEYIIYL